MAVDTLKHENPFTQYVRETSRIIRSGDVGVPSDVADAYRYLYRHPSRRGLRHDPTIDPNETEAQRRARGESESERLEREHNRTMQLLLLLEN